MYIDINHLQIIHKYTCNPFVGFSDPVFGKIPTRESCFTVNLRCIRNISFSVPNSGSYVTGSFRPNLYSYTFLKATTPGHRTYCLSAPALYWVHSFQKQLQSGSQSQAQWWVLRIQKSRRQSPWYLQPNKVAHNLFEVRVPFKNLIPAVLTLLKYQDGSSLSPQRKARTFVPDEWSLVKSSVRSYSFQMLTFILFWSLQHSRKNIGI